MQNEEETKKHLKVITFSSPNNRSTHLKNQKRFMKTKLKQQKTPSNNNTGNNSYEKRRTKKIKSYYLLISQK